MSIGILEETILGKSNQIHNTPSTALQQLALATINEIYPPEEYLRIYIDRSLSKIDGKAGAGSHSKLFSHYISVGSNRTSFDGEITAIAMALQQLLLRPTAFKKASSLWTLNLPSKLLLQTNRPQPKQYKKQEEQ